MGIGLRIKPSGLAERHNKPWSLVIRTHDLCGTDYEHITYLTDSQAAVFEETSNINFLYGPPDWDDRARLRKIEEARVLREKADLIEAQAST